MKNKRCPKCKNNFPATNEYFYKDKSSKDNFRCWCKKCVKIESKKWFARPENKSYRKKYESRPEIKIRRKKYDGEYRKKYCAKPENRIRLARQHKEYMENSENRIRHREIAKKSYLKREYNMTLEQKKEIYLEQNGCCAICKLSISFDKINIDHNHQTDKNRGLLCNKCNLGIGFFDDNPNTLIFAAIYLEKHKC